MRGLLSVAIALMLTVTPAVAQELTLKDFNTPDPKTIIRDKLAAVGVNVEGMAVLLSANDDCALGWSDDDLELMIWNVNMLAAFATPDGGQKPPTLDILLVSQVWSEKYESASRVARMSLCAPLRDVSALARR